VIVARADASQRVGDPHGTTASLDASSEAVSGCFAIALRLLLELPFAGPSSRARTAAGERQADEDAERAHQREVLVAVEPCSWGRQQERAERLVAVGAVAADEQVLPAHGLAALRAGGKLLPRPLAECAVGASGCLLPLPRRLQPKLGLLQPRARLRKLALCERERPFELRDGLRVRARLEAPLEELDDGSGEAEAAVGCVRVQDLLERVRNPGVEHRAHCQIMLARGLHSVPDWLGAPGPSR